MDQFSDLMILMRRRHMKRNSFVICLMILFLFSLATQCFGAVLNVQAFVDGRSQLEIQSNKVRWNHFDYDAPGWKNPGYEPTILNSTEWFPWPEDSIDSHLHCNGCYSEWYTHLSPALASTAIPIEVTVISPGPGERPGGMIWVVEQPSASNGYTAIVEFDDNSPPGGWDYIISITYSGAETPPTGIPTLSEWGMIIMSLLLAGSAIWMIRRRQIA
jgi:hypothetical protein